MFFTSSDRNSGPINISYSRAPHSQQEISFITKYAKTIKYGDTAFEDTAIQKRVKEKAEVFDRERVKKQG